MPHIWKPKVKPPDPMRAAFMEEIKQATSYRGLDAFRPDELVALQAKLEVWATQHLSLVWYAPAGVNEREP